MSKLSEQLQELMSEDGYTLSALADAMNTSHAKFSLYLNGKSAPNFKVFVALIEFFNCSGDYLIGLSDYPQREKRYNPVAPFGDRLRKLFEISKKSQYRFHLETNVSWSILHNWLTGKTKPSLDNLLKIARFFDCSVDFVLGREV